MNDLESLQSKRFENQNYASVMLCLLCLNMNMLQNGKKIKTEIFACFYNGSYMTRTVYLRSSNTFTYLITKNAEKHIFCHLF